MSARATAPPFSPAEDPQIEEILALGTYKEVYRASCGGKEIVLAFPSKDSFAIFSLLQEIDFYSRLPPHPNVVSFLGQCKGEIVRAGGKSSLRQGGHKPVLCLESMQGDMEEVVSLYGSALLEADNGFSLKVVWAALFDGMAQLARGLCHLEENGIIHLDLKPSNILIGVTEEKNEIHPLYKLADLGIAEELPPGEKWVESGKVGSPLYAAPEVLALGRACTATPVYSCGVIFSQLILGYHPYGSREGVALAAKGKFRLSLRPVCHLLPRPLVSLVCKMTRANPSERPTMQQAREILESLSERFPLC